MRTTASADPGVVLFGKTRRRVLGWLFGHPDERFFLRQLGRNTRVSVGALARELRLLTAAGLVSRTVEGRQTYFQANRDSPIYSDLASLLRKTVGAVTVLRESLGDLKQDIDFAFIFGSSAKGALRSSSDLDVFVVGAVTFEEIVRSLQDAQRALGREVNPVVYSRDEFQRKVRQRNPFLVRVMGEPKDYVIGGEDELGRLAEEWMASATQNERERSRDSSRARRSRPRR